MPWGARKACNFKYDDQGRATQHPAEERTFEQSPERGEAVIRHAHIWGNSVPDGSHNNATAQR